MRVHVKEVCAEEVHGSRPRSTTIPVPWGMWRRTRAVRIAQITLSNGPVLSVSNDSVRMIDVIVLQCHKPRTYRGNIHDGDPYPGRTDRHEHRKIAYGTAFNAGQAVGGKYHEYRRKDEIET